MVLFGGGFDDGFAALVRLDGSEDISLSVQDATAVAVVAYSPDGQTVATGAGDVLRLWDAATGTLLAEHRFNDYFTPFEAGEALRALHYTADGHVLYVASGGPTGGHLAALDTDTTPAAVIAKLCHEMVRHGLSGERWQTYFGARPYHETCPGGR